MQLFRSLKTKQKILHVKAKFDYVYGSRNFTDLINESCIECGVRQKQDFYNWFDNAYSKSKYFYKNYEKIKLNDLLDKMNKNVSSIKDVKKRTVLEVSFASWMHRMVKTAIPRFSLDRGFEFYNVMKYGERQCLLQSVLMAGMLQRAGINAGSAMVFRNITGEQSNNGHVITLVKLSDGDDIILDASEQVPFAKHQGLFVKNKDYVYVKPVFRNNSSRISGYITETSNKRLQNKDVNPLDYDYMRSQFWFYRGERTKGGLLYAKKTIIGLKAEETALSKSVKICPKNPLAVYILGRTYLAEGDNVKALKYLKAAGKLYKTYGWTPAGESEYLAEAGKPVIPK